MALILDPPIHADNSDENPLNVELTNTAWENLNQGKFKNAIQATERCIEEFGLGAEETQSRLEREQARVPPIGSKFSKNEREEIVSRGLLNDVATCHFIAGKAWEGLNNTSAAIAAYTKASKLTYARTWDPKGWFWSPSKEAKRLLKEFK